MKSLNERRLERVIREFVGPKGQVDPTGYQPVSMPSVVPQSPIGSARPGMASTTMQTPPDNQQAMQQQQQDSDQQNSDQQQANQDQGVNNQQNAAPQDPSASLPPALQRYVKMLSRKPASEVMAIRTAFNQALQNALMARSKSYGRMGMMANFNQARDMKTNFGQPPVQNS